MTTRTATETSSPTDTWTAQLGHLKSRYRHVREPILVALNILLHDQSIALDDAKAQAVLHGTRITAASVNAAKTLLAKMDAQDIAAGAQREPAVPPTTRPARPARRPRAADTHVDAEALIRGVVAKIQGQGNAEADRLREAMRKAIATLQAVLG